LTTAIVLNEAGTSYATAPLKTALAAHEAKLAKFNLIGNLAVATNTSTQAALIGYGYAPFVALTATQQLVVAEGLNKLTKATSATNSTPVALNFSGVDVVKTLAQANAYIDAAIAE